MKRNRLLLGVVISFVLLGLALRHIQPDRVVQALATADYRLVLLAAGLRLLALAFRAVRWSVVLAPVKRVSPRSLFPKVLIGYFSNYVLPSQSGELVRAYVLGRREGVSKSSTMATILVEKILDWFTLLLLLSLIFILFPTAGWIRQFGLVAGAIFAGGLLTLAAMLRYQDETARLVTRLVGRLSGGLALRTERIVRSFFAGLRVLRRGQHVGLAAAISLLIWSGQATLFVSIGRSLGLTAPLYAYVLLMALFNLSVFVPTMPGKLGTLEFIFAAVLGTFSTDRSTALTFALLFRATHIVPLLLGYVSLWQEGVRLDEVRELPREETAIPLA